MCYIPNKAANDCLPLFSLGVQERRIGPKKKKVCLFICLVVFFLGCFFVGVVVVALIIISEVRRPGFLDR